MAILMNFVAFNIGWFCSVIGGAKQMPWLGPAVVFAVIAYHLLRAQRPSSELMLILSCGLIGAFYDSLLVTTGWVTFPSGMFSETLAPYWIITMWMLFATTLNVSMRWMRGRPWLAAAFGFFGGPLAYYAGHRIGGIEFVNESAALAMLAVGWAVMMPLLMRLGETLDGVTEESSPVVAERIG